MLGHSCFGNACEQPHYELCPERCECDLCHEDHVFHGARIFIEECSRCRDYVECGKADNDGC